VTQEIPESDVYTTQQSEANQVLLVELLSAVPADIRIGVDDGNDWKAGTTWHPVGRLCHEAACELRHLHSVKTQLLEALQFIANRQDLMFAECSDAEQIIEVARTAIAKAKEQA
jgi:hypothetical protein